MEINKLLITIAALTAIVLAPVAHAADTATVNGKPIKQSWVDFIMKSAKARGQKGANLKATVLNELIGSELAYQAAVKKGLDKKEDINTATEIARRKIVVNAFFADFMDKHPVLDADTKAAYEQYKKELGSKEYKAQHILVKTEAEAKAVLAKLNKGGNFAKLAKEKSIDPGSKVRGGDLGWFPLATTPKPFSGAVSALKKGATVAAPVQTKLGWHIIKLNDSRTTKVPAYAKAKAGLKRTIQQRKLQKMMLDLKEKAEIVAPDN